MKKSKIQKNWNFFYSARKCSAKINVVVDVIYSVLKKNNILNGYIVPEYEVLHTQSRLYCK